MLFTAQEGAKLSLISLQIRPSDCDDFGHVNNAIYVSYFQQALAECEALHLYKEAWRPEGEYRWVPERFNLEYRRPAMYGDLLEGNLWLAKPHSTHPVFGFEICSRSPSTGADASVAVFRARGVWCLKHRESGRYKEIAPDRFAELSGKQGGLPREFHTPAASIETRRYSWDHCIELREVAPDKLVHPQALYQWLEESLFDASAQAGWPLERWFASGFFTLQTRHDSEIFTLPRRGENIRITSRIVEVRRLGGTWLQEVHRTADDQLIARDYSTGVFLNLDGRPAAPPAEILNDIQFG